MSTRSITVFTNLDGDETVVMYKQHDGYVEGGYGWSLAAFLAGKTITNSLGGADTFNTFANLVACVVAEFTPKDDAGEIYLFPAGTRDCGEEFTYYVTELATAGAAETRGGRAMEPTWTPRRDGEIYCSPACGCRCRWTDYERAVKDASDLAGRLGASWEPAVWENNGWHWRVTVPSSQRLEIAPPNTNRPTYLARLGSHLAEGSTAVRALESVVVRAEADSQKIAALVAHARAVLAKRAAADRSCPGDALLARLDKLAEEAVSI